MMEWWPYTPEEAEAMRPKIAAYLRELADQVESGEVEFDKGDRITINWEKQAIQVRT